MDLELRKTQVRALLATAQTADPAPQPTLRSTSGPAPSRLVPCTHCNRTGRIRDDLAPSRTRFCPLCENGWRKRRKGDNEVFDGMMGVPVRVAETRSQSAVRAFKLDEDIRRLSGLLLKLGEEVSDTRQDLADEVVRYQRRRRSLERGGSYQELGRALRVLSDRSRCVYRAVVKRWLLDVPRRLSDHEMALEDLGIHFLSVEMRGAVSVPEWARDKARADQTATLVRELHEKTGWGAVRIAKALQVPVRKAKLALRGTVVPSDAPVTLNTSPESIREEMA